MNKRFQLAYQQGTDQHIILSDTDGEAYAAHRGVVMEHTDEKPNRTWAGPGTPLEPVTAGRR